MNCPGRVDCLIFEAKGYDTCQRAGSCQIEDDRLARHTLRQKCPYPVHCSMPAVCSTDGRCHRDPCCID